MSGSSDTEVYVKQGFGKDLELKAPFGLLLIDFVNGFADEAWFGGGNIRDAIACSVDLLAAARERGWPVAHTRIVFADDASDANVFSDKIPSMLHLTEAAEISQIVPDLAPRPGELVVRKQLPSGFAGTSLQGWLTRHGVRTLMIAGCTTSGCVRASVLDAVGAGFVPIVVRDCVGDRAIGPHEANLFDMEKKYAQILDRDTVLAAATVPA